MGQGGESGRGNPLPATIVFTEDDFVTIGFFFGGFEMIFFVVLGFSTNHFQNGTMNDEGFLFGFGLGVWNGCCILL